MKLMTDPKARNAIQQMMQNPEARQMMSQGLKDPKIKDMIKSNPLISGMASKAGVDMDSSFDDLAGQLNNPGGLPGFGGFPGGFPGGFQPPQPPPAQATASVDMPAEPEDIDEADEIDEPKLALLNPPHGGVAFPSQLPFEGFAALLAPMPEAVASALRELAVARAEHHLGSLALLEAKRVDTAGAQEALDLLLCQGAFAGELAWYAICRLEEEHGDQHFVALAKHALSSVTFNSGYRVASFNIQLLRYLAEHQALDEDALRWATWGLSGQPRDGVDGLFEIDWEDFDELLAEALKATDDDALVCAFMVALLGWQELDRSERPRGAEHALAALPQARRQGIEAHLLVLLGGERELEGVRSNFLPQAVATAIAERLVADLGPDPVLDAAASWRLRAPFAPQYGVLQALDIQWTQSSDAKRDAFFEKIFDCEDVELRRFAFRVGAAWAPHEFLERAALDPAKGIRRWAERELKSLH